MRLKATTWALATLTVLLLLGWPVLVGLPPKGATRAMLGQYAWKSEIWFIALIVCFLGTTVFAALVVRQSREEYLRESEENLKLLIEGTLSDHRKKRGTEDRQG